MTQFNDYAGQIQTLLKTSRFKGLESVSLVVWIAPTNAAWSCSALWV